MRQQAVLEVVALMLFEVAALWLLHRLGAGPHIGIDWFDPVRWLAATAVDQVVMSLLWFAALVLAWWTLGSTLLYLMVRVSGVRVGARIAERLAFPAIRRTIDRAIAATLVGSALLGSAPAAAAEQPLPIMGPETHAASEYEPRPAGTEQPEPTPSPTRMAHPVPSRPAPEPVRPPAVLRPRPSATPTATATTEPADRAPQGKGERGRAGGRGSAGDDERGRAAGRDTPRAGERYTVRVGDHLWKIAAEVVSASDGGAGDRASVAAYWADLVRTATPHLRSGDPNLIYPGEPLELPPLPTRAGERR